MPKGDRQPVELLEDETAWRAEPARVAAELGHAVEWNPGTQARWTCACGRSVLRVGTNIYGSATEESCDRAPVTA